MRWTGSKTQIEVWPLPASAQTLRVVGIRELRSLISNSDVADLDDQMIVLFAAAKILKAKKAEDWEDTLSAANSRRIKMRGRTKGASKMTIYGGGDQPQSRRHGTIIRIA